jgi:hypothetical protein
MVVVPQNTAFTQRAMMGFLVLEDIALWTKILGILLQTFF